MDFTEKYRAERDRLRAEIERNRTPAAEGWSPGDSRATARLWALAGQREDGDERTRSVSGVRSRCRYRNWCWISSKRKGARTGHLVRYRRQSSLFWTLEKSQTRLWRTTSQKRSNETNRRVAPSVRWSHFTTSWRPSSTPGWCRSGGSCAAASIRYNTWERKRAIRGSPSADASLCRLAFSPASLTLSAKGPLRQAIHEQDHRLADRKRAEHDPQIAFMNLRSGRGARHRPRHCWSPAASLRGSG